jgi:hypothetical protein
MFDANENEEEFEVKSAEGSPLAPAQEGEEPRFSFLDPENLEEELSPA